MTTETLTIQSKAFGAVTISPAQIVEFAEGLFGFGGHTRFALLDAGDGSWFKWLQSLEDPEVAFVVIQPEVIDTAYRPEFDWAETRDIELDNWEDTLIFVLVTIPGSDPGAITANFQGPLLINKKNKKARQIISQSEGHSVRVPVMEKLEQNA